MSDQYRCPTCKREVTLTSDRNLPIHTLDPRKPAKGACSGSLLSVNFVSGGRVK